MKKILFVLLSIVLFWVSYQVRVGYIVTRDYNEPSDWQEYMQSRPGANGVVVLVTDFLKGKGITQSEWLIKHNTNALNIHGTPLYMLYLVFLSKLGLTPQQAAPILHAGFVVFLFFVIWKLFPPWVALVVGGLASVYTPLFAFIYSWMPESITPVIIPLSIIVASMVVTQAKKASWYILVGFLLFLAGFTRHVFAYYGVFFIFLWMVITPKRTKPQLIALIFGYLLPTLAWRLWLSRFSESVYVPGAIESSLVVEHRLSTDGWGMDAIKGLTWWDVVYRVILHQNPFSLVLLELERVGRLWKTAANSYSTSFPIPQASLQLVHTLVLFFAAWGVRYALKNKILLFLASLILWNTVFVTLYYVEEIRYQMPVIGLVLLLAGAGICEVVMLLKKRHTRTPVIAICALFFIWLFAQPYLIGLELWLVPFISDSRVWRWVHSIAATGVMAYVTMKLYESDTKAKIVISHPWARRLYFSLPLAMYLIVFTPSLRSRTWHEWQSQLRQGQRIEQQIVIKKEVLQKLVEKKGYLIIDFQDANAGQYLFVTVNGKERNDYLSMGKRVSGVDLMATRQWQRTLPRLGGYTHIEGDLFESPTWPDLHEWLVIPMDGGDMQEVNNVTIENNNLLSSQPAYIFGDYAPYDRGFYEGPTPRLFQGNRTHNKYQVERDMRLTEQRSLKSMQNKSTLVNGRGERTDDLSTLPGLQRGRYRIFFLFPFSTGDPEDIF